MKPLIRYTVSMGILLAAFVFLTGCGLKKQAKEKGNKLEYTVVEELSIPEELKSMIEEKKAGRFQVSYADGKELYLAVGYGEQPTEGYSIVVERLEETPESIYMETNLLGPDKEETISLKPSYPYIVIKTKFCDKDIYYE